MEAYRKKLKREVVMNSIFTVLALALIVLSWLRDGRLDNNQHAESFFQGFQAGLFACWAGIMIHGIVTSVRALRNEEKLRILYIKEHDERTREIVMRAQSKAYKICLIVLMTAAVVSGFYSTTVFSTLLVVVAFMAVCGGIIMKILGQTL